MALIDICTNCLEECKYLPVDASFSHHFGTQDVVEYVSKCCREDILQLTEPNFEAYEAFRQTTTDEDELFDFLDKHRYL